MSDSDKTHAPTPRRREQARRDGQVAQSQEVGSIVLLASSIVLLLMSGGSLWEFLHEMLRSSLGGSGWRHWIGQENPSQLASEQWTHLSASLGRLLLPILAGAGIVTAAVQWLQTGFLFRPERMLPDFARVNPVSGLARIFSGGQYGRLALGLLKVAAAGGIAAWALWSRREQLASLAGRDLGALAPEIGHILLATGGYVAAVLALLAAVDYGVVRWRLNQRLSMTVQEFREEMRDMQGDPQVAARRNQLRRAARDAKSAGQGNALAPSASRHAAPSAVGTIDSIP